MSSLPVDSALTMPPFERSRTDRYPDVSPTSNGHPNQQPYGTAGYVHGSALCFNPAYHHQLQPQTYQYQYTSPFPSQFSGPGSAHFDTHDMGMMYQPDLPHHFDPALYYGALPTLPPRFSASGSAGMPNPGRSTGCISPLDLFGSLPTAQSLPASLSILGGNNTFVQAPEAVDADDADVGGAPEMGLQYSPGSSSADSLAEIEEEPVQGSIAKKAKTQREGGASGNAEMLSPRMEEGPTLKGGKKRSRTAQACEKCRGRKAKCFGGQPCDRCIKRGFQCEFAAVRPRPTAKHSPKPRVRRHSMASIPLSSANPTFKPSTSAATIVPGHAHSHSLSTILPTPSLFPLTGRAPDTAAPIPVAPPSTHAGSALGLGLGLHFDFELSPAPAEDDGEAEGDSDLEMPGMSNSFSGSGSVTTSISSGAGGSGANWPSQPWGVEQGLLYNSEPMMTEDDIFTFSPVQSSLEWGVVDTSSSMAAGPNGMSGSSMASDMGGYERDRQQAFMTEGLDPRMLMAGRGWGYRN